MNNLQWLQEWYKKNCNGSWEHLYGVIIETLDNPGWHVKIELQETKFVNLQPDELKRNKDNDEWIACSILNGVFHGYGDCTKLEMIIETFKKWVDE